MGSGSSKTQKSDSMFRSYKVEHSGKPSGDKANNMKSNARAGELPWREALDKVAEMAIWDEKNREERSPWKEYLQKADDLMKKPRKPMPEEVVGPILEGDMATVDTSRVPSGQPKVIVFISSTFTDTKAERNHLMKDVYPYLRSLCRRIGLEFGTVDMRWGVTEEATLEHSTVDMCINEIYRCINDSVGPAFLCLLGHKYGFRPLPGHIDQTEFDTLLHHLQQTRNDTQLMRDYYMLDNNAVPPEYVLKPMAKDNKTWWDDVEHIQEQMRVSSVACFSNKNRKCDKYHISVTETEIHTGVFENPNFKSQASFVFRDLVDYTSEFHKDRKILDLIGGNIDEYAREKLGELRNKKIPSKAEPTSILNMTYNDAKPKAISEHIKYLCEHVCGTMADRILDKYEKRLHVEEDQLFQEVLQHRKHANEKANLFVGRENELQKIADYLRSHDCKPLVVHGQSGCGKTALMAVAARKTKDTFSHGVMVLRFLGTTSESASARLLLSNICTQITRVYGKDVTAIPNAYKDLVKHFRTCLAYASSGKPLTLFLDSIDQLSNEDLGHNLAWLSLSEDLPANVKLILSTLPTRSLDILHAHLKDSNFIEVQALTLNEGPEILKKMLDAQHRRVTDLQKTVIMDAFKKCPLPLFLRLVVDIAVKWKSYTTVDSTDVATDIPGLISMLFDRIESRYGEMFVRNALGFITAAKNGLSLAELEDILSCDDEVLDSIFQWWIPPIRRIPPLLWARVRSELGIYLAEKGTDGVNAYGWYHRQFWETAEKRYLESTVGGDSEKFALKAHTAIADYFEGKWETGKPYKNKTGTTIEDRKIPKQPLVVSAELGTRRKRQLNRRKLTELPYHLIKLQDWNRFRNLVLDLEYIEAKFEAGDGYICLGELTEALKRSGCENIKQMKQLVGSNMGFLIREPTGVYQMALQQNQRNKVRQIVNSMSRDKLPIPLMENQNEVDYEDPCEMTLHGHTAVVRCCDFSPKGDLILSSGDDCTMRIWDATTGAELVTVTSLPEPIPPDKSEGRQLILHPVNPACFSRTGEKIANGTENGGVMLWDTSGVQLHAVTTPNKAVVYIQFSPDNRHIATAFKNSVLSVWSAKDLSHVTTVNFDWVELTCLDYSKDGRYLAVMSVSGLILLNTEGYSVKSMKTTKTDTSICCTFHPSGKQVMTGGDDHCVSIWDADTGDFRSKMKQHNAWIWSIKFTQDGNHMFTCSSDRCMKVWKHANGSWSVIATVGGHSHRVSMVSIEQRKESQLVTSSLDRSLKVWDMSALLRGAVPPSSVGNYLSCVTSPDGVYLATSKYQACKVTHANNYDDSAPTIATSEEHQPGNPYPPLVRMAQFTNDSTKLCVLDLGHPGTYEYGWEVKAKLEVMNIVPKSSIFVDVHAPTAFSIGKYNIFVGTLFGDLHSFSMDDYTEVVKWSSGNKGVVTRVASCTGSSLVAACFEKICKVWKVVGSDVNHLKDLNDHDSDIQEMAFSPNGQNLVVGVSSGKLYIWNTSKTTVELYRTATEHESNITDIKFSASGNYLVTSAGLSMRVWDVRNGFSLKCSYYSPVYCAAFLNDNMVIAGEATGNRKYLKFRD